MMRTYAYAMSGSVAQIIPPEFYRQDSPEGADPSYLEGEYIPLNRRYTPEFCSTCVDITDLVPQPQEGWTYIDGVFAAPQPYQPTPAEILANNTETRDSLLRVATLAIGPLQDAVDLEDATPGEIALLKKWKQYRVAVNRIVLTLPSPVWPSQP